MSLRLALAAFGVALTIALHPNAQALNVGDIIVQPESPRVSETVRVVTAIPGCTVATTRRLTLAMSGNRVTVTIPEQAAGACGIPPPPTPFDVALGQFPPGNYEVEVVRMLEDEGGRLVSAGTRTFTVRQRAESDPLTNYTDIWWNPNESGWGLNVVQHPTNVIFATWFSYDNDGTPRWYVVPEGSWSVVDSGRYANHIYTGPIFRTSGPVGGQFDPSRITATRVGTAQLIFGQWDFLLATLTIDGRTIEKRLQRQSF